MKIRLLPEAIADLEVGADFYLWQDSDAGLYFLNCLVADIETLKISAGTHVVYRGFFRALSRRFPFAIYYKVTDDCVDVYAILDCRRDPRIIESLLKSGKAE